MDWRVEDFKGIVECNLNLAPGTTTILTGTNSSGKTSLLQSLLLMRQSGQAGDGIVLNGPLVRLGKATDVVRSGATNSTAKFHLAQDGKQYRFEIAASTKRKRVVRDDEADPFSSEMHLTDLAISTVEGARRSELHLAKDHSNTKDVQLILAQRKKTGNVSVLHLKYDESRVPARKFTRIYLVFNGLRCVEVVKLFTVEAFRETYTKQLRTTIDRYRKWSDATSNTYDESLIFNTRSLTRMLNNDLAAHLDRVSARKMSREKRANMRYRQYTNKEIGQQEGLANLLTLSDYELDELIQNVVDDRCAFPGISIQNAAWALAGLYDSPWFFDNQGGTLEFSLFETCREVLSEVNSFAESCDKLTKRINYIGPLRDEPRVVWSQWNSQTPGLPVGSRGELTANYYAKNSERTINFVGPPDGGNRQETTSTLENAVQQWIQYLGIGSKISSRSFGKIGVGIEVTWKGNKRDLTSLGVGVSQALPIVIAGLAAPRGAIFIVEQPELHLHPDVQSRLADFFLYSRPDMNYLIETHSEALITRVRRRIAEQELNPENVRLTFIEPGTARRGRRARAFGARSRNIHFTTMGDLSEWPEGFISGSLDDTRAIMKATVARLTSGEQV